MMQQKEYREVRCGARRQAFVEPAVALACWRIWRSLGTDGGIFGLDTVQFRDQTVELLEQGGRQICTTVP